MKEDRESRNKADFRISWDGSKLSMCFRDPHSSKLEPDGVALSHSSKMAELWARSIQRKLPRVGLSGSAGWNAANCLGIGWEDVTVESSRVGARHSRITCPEETSMPASLSNWNLQLRWNPPESQFLIYHLQTLVCKVINIPPHRFFVSCSKIRLRRGPRLAFH